MESLLDRPASFRKGLLARWEVGVYANLGGRTMTTAGILERMDSKESLEHANLRDSLNAACYEIADAIIHGAHVLSIEIPGALGVGDVDEYIPGRVHNLAVNSGWLPKPHELEPGHGEILGDFVVDDAYRDWFIGLLADSLSDLREMASTDNDAKAEQTKSAMHSMLATWGVEQALTKLSGKPDAAVRVQRHPPLWFFQEYLRKSEEVFDIKEFVLQKVVPLARTRYKRIVSLASVSRICTGHTVGPSIRQIVAEALNELVPCTRDDLLPLE